MELYSGQGRINLAKRNADGSTQPEFFFGNVPSFSVNFLTGHISLTIDELRDEALEIICGSKLAPRIPIDWYADGSVAEAVQFKIGDSSPFEYELTFRGVNTAHNNSQWLVRLTRVTFTPAENWELISEGFAVIVLSGMAHKDEVKGGRGEVYRLHKESVTGNRLTDNHTEVVTACD